MFCSGRWYSDVEFSEAGEVVVVVVSVECGPRVS